MSENAYSLFMRGGELLASGHPHGAVVALEKARSIEPSKGSIREALARAYFATGRVRAAESEFGAALEIDPSNHYAHFGMALCLERRGLLARARGHAKLACVMRPDIDDYERALARIAFAS